MTENSKPYIITITNSALGTQPVRLFGMNKNLLLPNFGNSAVGIQIFGPGGTYLSYGQLLSQSGAQPFEISQWKMSASQDPPLSVFPPVIQLPILDMAMNTMKVNYFDANRRKCIDPQDINQDSYQLQLNQVVFYNKIKVDGNTEILFDMQGAAIDPFWGLVIARLVLKIYPQRIIVPSRKLIALPEMTMLSVPKITGVNSISTNNQNIAA